MLVRNILSEMQPDAPPFGSLDGWFMHFKARHRINKRQATNSCQKEPHDKRGAIQQFHRSIHRSAKEREQVGPLGRWTPRNISQHGLNTAAVHPL